MAAAFALSLEKDVRIFSTDSDIINLMGHFSRDNGLPEQFGIAPPIKKISLYSSFDRANFMLKFSYSHPTLSVFSN